MAFDLQGQFGAVAELARIGADDVLRVVVGGDVHRHPRVLRNQLGFHGGNENADLHRCGARVASHRRGAGIHQIIRLVVEGKPDQFASPQQAIDVVAQPKHRGAAFRFADAQIVEGQRPPLQALGEHMNGGVLPSDELAVAPNGSLVHAVSPGPH